MHRPRASLILKIVPNAKVYAEHSADLHVAPEKPSLLVPIRTLIFSVWRVGNVDLRGQNSLALRSWLFIFLFNCTSFYLQFLLSEPGESFFFKWIRLVFVFLQTNTTSNSFETQFPPQHTTSVRVRVCMCVQRWWKGLNTSFHKYYSYSNAYAVNNHLHQENAWWLLPCIRTADWTLVFLLRKSVLQNWTTLPASSCRREQILRPL